MQIKNMKSYIEWRKMYAAWINTGSGWFFSDLLFESADSLRKHYKGMPEFAMEGGHPLQAKRWENAEIVVVSAEVPVPDGVKEVQE